MNDLQIKPVRADIAAVFAETLPTLTPWRELGYQADTLQRYLAQTQDGFQALCLHAGDKPLAVMTIRTPWLRGTLMELLAVLPEHQGHGYGKWLIDWVKNSSIEQNRHNVWTLVSAFNHRAIAFYHAQGFVEVGTLDNLIAEGQDEIFLRAVIK
ncbi:MAG: GNAT family N-acetyltransferase [Gammaproteobacteria bacterium]|nr:GNAT family N-acetyltransferase [Gammaproteobacteria bacterium]MDH5653603.1 GNAT family N-acetyltransferase [Gammaproteobacteria bacterium]